jgi:hypothetical protein
MHLGKPVSPGLSNCTKGDTQMFKIQTRLTQSGMPSKSWRDFGIFKKTFATEDDAWAYVGSLDQDGYVDRRTYRVVAA